MQRRWQPHHTVWAVLVTGWVGNYMVRVGIAPVLVPLIQEFQLSYTQAGLLATAFFYAYTFMQLPAGLLGDRLGRKVMLLFSTTCTATMSLLTAGAASFPALFVFRFFTGVGQGTYFVNDRPVIAAYTPKDQMGFGQGVSFTGLGIGMCLGVLLSGLIAERWGWRAVFFSFALLPLLATTGIALLIREPPRTREAPGVRRPWGVIFRSRDLWLLNVGGIAAVYALWVVGTWAPAMFKEVGVGELSRASLYSSLLGLAAIPGLIVTGWLSDWLVARGKGRKALIGLELLAIAGSMFLMGYAVEARANVVILAGLVFVSGLFIWGIWAPMYALIPEMVPKEILGTTYGFTNSMHFLGSLLAPWLTGAIKDATGSFAWGGYAAGLIGVAGGLLILGMRPAFRWGRDVPVLSSS